LACRNKFGTPVGFELPVLLGVLFGVPVLPPATAFAASSALVPPGGGGGGGGGGK